MGVGTRPTRPTPSASSSACWRRGSSRASRRATSEWMATSCCHCCAVPRATKVVVLKSGTGWQTTYEGKCAAMIRADCPGPMNYNVASFPWEQVARPIYPLDEAMEWAAEAGSEGGARL